MKCKLCGQSLTKETALRACGHCFLHADFHLIKCPNCGYRAFISRIQTKDRTTFKKLMAL